MPLTGAEWFRVFRVKCAHCEENSRYVSFMTTTLNTLWRCAAGETVASKESSRECDKAAATHWLGLTSQDSSDFRRSAFLVPSVGGFCIHTFGIVSSAEGSERYTACRSVSRRFDLLLCRMKPYRMLVPGAVNRFPLPAAGSAPVKTSHTRFGPIASTYCRPTCKPCLGVNCSDHSVCLSF